jgi:hypothetical protein
MMVACVDGGGGGRQVCHVPTCSTRIYIHQLDTERHDIIWQLCDYVIFSGGLRNLHSGLHVVVNDR